MLVTTMFRRAARLVAARRHFSVSPSPRQKVAESNEFLITTGQKVNELIVLNKSLESGRQINLTPQKYTVPTKFNILLTLISIAPKRDSEALIRYVRRISDVEDERVPVLIKDVIDKGGDVDKIKEDLGEIGMEVVSQRTIRNPKMMKILKIVMVIVLLIVALLAAIMYGEIVIMRILVWPLKILNSRL